ncbi:MAG: hypothetical protein EOO38_10890 [Cytophagaceae bacterium]|jgi:hypothetical protein|nr:MAG: hypothetical protein EOO38_10890 [Cytophagaceae bacterium]
MKVSVPPNPDTEFLLQSGISEREQWYGRLDSEINQSSQRYSKATESRSKTIDDFFRVAKYGDSKVQGPLPQFKPLEKPLSARGFLHLRQKMQGPKGYVFKNASKDTQAHVDVLMAQHGRVRLVVGGQNLPDGSWHWDRGYESAARANKPWDVSINTDSEANPDVFGGIASSETMLRFADNTFQDILFQNVSPSVFTSLGDLNLANLAPPSIGQKYALDDKTVDFSGEVDYVDVTRGRDALTQAYRVLAPNGFLTILAGGKPLTDTHARELVDDMVRLGMQFIAARFPRPYFFRYAAERGLQIDFACYSESSVQILARKLPPTTSKK